MTNDKNPTQIALGNWADIKMRMLLEDSAQSPNRRLAYISELEVIGAALQSQAEKDRVIGVMREALEFYSSPYSYQKDMNTGQTDISNDCGNTATNALVECAKIEGA